MGRASIYPEISITFTCDGKAHYHLPLLLSDNSYTTYREEAEADGKTG